MEFVPARVVLPFDWKREDHPMTPRNQLNQWWPTPPKEGISPAFAMLESKTMEDFCNSPIDGLPRTCPRCGELRPSPMAQSTSAVTAG